MSVTSTAMPRMETSRILSVAYPVEQCIYCWYLLNQETPYPEQWSSTCCQAHCSWLLEQLATRREARANAERETREQV